MVLSYQLHGDYKCHPKEMVWPSEGQDYFSDYQILSTHIETSTIVQTAEVGARDCTSYEIHILIYAPLYYLCLNLDAVSAYLSVLMVTFIWDPIYISNSNA